MVIKILYFQQNINKMKEGQFFVQFYPGIPFYIINFNNINKRIMKENEVDLQEDINIDQKRCIFDQPKDRKVQFICNLIIYCGQYYPLTQKLTENVVRELGDSFVDQIYEAVKHLYGCIEKEVIVGPSTSFFPPAELPALAKKDVLMERAKNPFEQLIKEWMATYEELRLEKVIPKDRVTELMWYNFSRLLSMKNVQQNSLLYKKYRQELEIDGQNWLESTPFSSLIILLEHVLELIVTQFKLANKDEKNFRLLWARLSYLHNKHLKFPVKKLCQVVLGNYKQVIALSVNNTTFEDYIQLLLEYAFAFLFYYKYSQCETIIRHCGDLLKMKMEFSGKLGRRTKYQTFDTPLLVMDLVKKEQKDDKEEKNKQNQDEEGEVVLIDAKELVNKQRGIEASENKNQLSAASFDSESILLQTPKFIEESGQNKKQLKEVNEHHLLVSLATLFYEWKTTPHDEMLIQNIAAAIDTLLKYKISTSFSFNFSLLLLRSLNQFPKLKNVERALDQLQKLRNSFNTKTNKSTYNIYASPYQSRLEYVLILADKYMEVGLSMTAVDLFEQAGLYEECIDGLVAKNYKEKALKLVLRLIEDKGKNPRLLCMLGDIKKGSEVQYYEQSWELSKKTYARAQRSLGWHYFNKNQFQKATESFIKATQASYYHPNTWYTLGCCFMRIQQYEKALKAFSECISIDDTQGEAWGNMASCYLFSKKLNEAFSTLLQAVKHSQGNWKLWVNLLSVSLSTKNFYKYLECMERLVKLGHQEVLTEETFAKVVQIMKYNNETAERKRVLFAYKNRIDRLFAFFNQKIGENELVWRGWTNYQIQLLQYYDIIGIHYHNLHIQKKLDINDLIPGYQTIESTNLNTKVKQAETKQRIVQYKQTELNMTMKIGWDENKIICQKVRKVLEEYIDIYRQFSTRSDKDDFKLFVGGLASKIQHCLQQPYEVVLEWL